MNPRLLELAARRGELRARCAAQREALAAHAWPLENALAAADRAALGVDWLKRHPAAVGAAALGLALARPRRAWAWAKRGFFLWQGWKALQAKLTGAR